MSDIDFTEAGQARLREWVARAEVSFADPKIGVERRVHLLRVTGKRLRAILSLAQGGGKPKKWAARHVESIQDAARSLGPYRDAAVSAELLAKRERKERSERLRILWQRWGSWRLENAHSETEPPPVLLTRMVLAVQEAEERLGKWLRRQGDPEPLIDGWERSVKTLKNGARGFFERPENAAAHEWRKGMKELWFQTDWLRAMGIEVPLQDTKPLDRLSASLGRANDFAVLQDWLWQIRKGPWAAEERLVLDGHLETLKRKAWQRVGLSWGKVVASLEPQPEAEPMPAASPFSEPVAISIVSPEDGEAADENDGEAPPASGTTGA